MIYLDHGATSFPKPLCVRQAVDRALRCCANPGRGGHDAAMEAQQVVYTCRERAAQLFACNPEQVVCTTSCTHGLNIAIRTLVQPGDPVLISGFEHNAVVRPLQALQARIQVAGRKLFDWEDTLENWEKALKKGVKVAIFTHTSNVFGYILPVQEMGKLCKQYGVPFILDAAQSAGSHPVSMAALEADFIAMPGHKGLLGPQGTGLLLCRRLPEPLLFGGTGSLSASWQMPDFLPDRAEAGTLNVPGIAGLAAGLQLVQQIGLDAISHREQTQAQRCAADLQEVGLSVFHGPHQGGTVSFVPAEDCEEFAARLARRGVAARAGLHCAPLAHESAGTLETGTVRVCFGHAAADWQREAFVGIVKKML